MKQEKNGVGDLNSKPSLPQQQELQEKRAASEMNWKL